MGWAADAGAGGIRFGVTNAGDSLNITASENVEINSGEFPTLRLNGVGITFGPDEPTDPARGDYWFTYDDGGGD